MMVNDHIWWRLQSEDCIEVDIIGTGAGERVLTEDCKEKNLSAEGNIYLGQIQ